MSRNNVVSSRVEDIKRRFEVPPVQTSPSPEKMLLTSVNHRKLSPENVFSTIVQNSQLVDSTSPRLRTPIKNVSHIKQMKLQPNFSALYKQVENISNQTPSLRQRQSECDISPKSSLESARSPFERQSSALRGNNIRRSPAFRCDKIVKGRPRSFTDSYGELPIKTNLKRLNSSPHKHSRPEQYQKPQISHPKPKTTPSPPNPSLKPRPFSKPIIPNVQYAVVNKHSKKPKNEIFDYRKVYLSGHQSNGNKDSNSKETSPKHTLQPEPNCTISSQPTHPESPLRPDTRLNVSPIPIQLKSRNINTSPKQSPSNTSPQPNHSFLSKQMSQTLQRLDNLTNQSDSTHNINPPIVHSSDNPNHLDTSPTLKIALNSPLPSGPPPRKPPRTFAHHTTVKPPRTFAHISKPVIVSPKPSSNLYGRALKSPENPSVTESNRLKVNSVLDKSQRLSGGSSRVNDIKALYLPEKNNLQTTANKQHSSPGRNLNNEILTTNNVFKPEKLSNSSKSPPHNFAKPVRSKTESEIMLRKLENVLMNHQKAGVVIQPNPRDISSPSDQRFNSSITKSHRVNQVSPNVSDAKRREISPNKTDFNNPMALYGLNVNRNSPNTPGSPKKMSYGQNFDTSRDLYGHIHNAHTVSIPFSQNLNIPRTYSPDLIHPNNDHADQLIWNNSNSPGHNTDNLRVYGQIDNSKFSTLKNSVSGHQNNIFGENEVTRDAISLGCLEAFNCVGASSHFRQSHMYEKQNEKNCEFFVDLLHSPEVQRITLRKSTSAEHIYAEPYDHQNARHSLESTSPRAFPPKKILAMTDSKLVEIGHFKGTTKYPQGNNQELPLHYLCTPITTDLNSTSPGTSRSNPTSPTDQSNQAQLARAKIQSMMNQAFGNPSLNDAITASDSESTASTPEEMSLTSGFLEQDSNETPDPSGGHAETDLVKQTKERKHYVRRVSCRLPPMKRPETYPHLFQYVLLVGLNMSGGQNTPYIKSKFPPDADVAPHIEHFCFPDSSYWPITKSTSDKSDEQSYSLVITNDKGERTFGYCRRIVPEGMDICLPLAYCIISPFRATGFYYKVLSELESHHGQPEVQLTAYIMDLYNCQMPGPGGSLKPALKPGDPSVNSARRLTHSATIVKRPMDLRLEEKDLTQLFDELNVATLLKVFGTLLHERRVILFSSSLSKLSSCIEALQTILYPFSWQHTFIPVLPLSQMEYCDAPTPFIFGVLKDKDGQIPEVSISDGIIIDQDNSKILQCVGDEGSILPTKLRRSLKVALQMVAETPKLDSRNVLISEAFMRFFVETCGHYQSCIINQLNGQKAFDRETFKNAIECTQNQMFLDWFTETAMFQSFMSVRIERGARYKGVFEQRSLEHWEESEKNTVLFLKNRKPDNKKFKTLGDRFKDWTPFAKTN